jgi:hypothetical protein
MVTHPIHITRKHYRGSDKGKQSRIASHNQLVAELERHINDLLLKQEYPIQVYDFADIARGIGYSLDFVSEVEYSIDGGSNGFTAWKHGMTHDEAIAANANRG